MSWPGGRWAALNHLSKAAIPKMARHFSVSCPEAPRAVRCSEKDLALIKEVPGKNTSDWAGVPNTAQECLSLRAVEVVST